MCILCASCILTHHLSISYGNVPNVFPSYTHPTLLQIIVIQIMNCKFYDKRGFNNG